MNAYPLFRLFWRRGLLYDFAVTALFLLVLAAAGMRGGVKLFGSLSEQEAGYVADHSFVFLACLLLGTAVGVVTNFAMQDLLYNRFSWGLPNLAKLLRKGFFLVAAIATILGGAIGYTLEVTNYDLGFLQGAALGLLGFGLGNQIWDRVIGPRFSLIVIAVLFSFTLGAEHLAAWAVEYPWLFPPAALIVAGLSILRSTKHQGIRTRCTVPASQLGVSFDRAGRTEANAAAKKNARSGYPLWQHGHIKHSNSWIRAQCYEQYGWIRGLWNEMTFKLVLVTACMVSALCIGAVVLGETDSDSLVAPIAVGALMLPVMTLFFTRTDLRRGTLYTISRSQRADLIWHSCRLHGFTTVILTAVIVLIPRVFGALFLASSGRDTAGATTLAIAIALSMFIPLAQWSRLRWIEPKQLSANSPSFILVFSIVAIAFMVFVNGSLIVILEIKSSMTTSVIWISVPFLWLGCQHIFRSKLRKHLATVDLN